MDRDHPGRRRPPVDVAIGEAVYVPGPRRRVWHTGPMLRWLTAGESHGPALMAVLEGLPAGVPHDHHATSPTSWPAAGSATGAARAWRSSATRSSSSAACGTASTQGGPLAIRVGNTEWPKWSTVMSADPVDAEELEGLARNAPLTRPRPGHADLVGMQKYGFDDARPVLERASARETAARVALGAVAKAFLLQAYGVAGASATS